MTEKTIKRPAFVFKDSQSVREKRRRLGLNQSEFWSRVSVTQSGGSRYESGRDMPEPVMIAMQIAYGNEKQAKEMFDWLRRDGNSNVVRVAHKKAA